MRASSMATRPPTMKTRAVCPSTATALGDHGAATRLSTRLLRISSTLMLSVLASMTNTRPLRPSIATAFGDGKPLVGFSPQGHSMVCTTRRPTVSSTLTRSFAVAWLRTKARPVAASIATAIGEDPTAMRRRRRAPSASRVRPRRRAPPGGARLGEHAPRLPQPCVP